MGQLIATEISKRETTDLSARCDLDGAPRVALLAARPSLRLPSAAALASIRHSRRTSDGSGAAGTAAGGGSALGFAAAANEDASGRGGSGGGAGSTRGSGGPALLPQAGSRLWTDCAQLASSGLPGGVGGGAQGGGGAPGDAGVAGSSVGPPLLLRANSAPGTPREAARAELAVCAAEAEEAEAEAEAEAVEAEAAGADAEAGPFDCVQPGFVPSGCASDLT